MKNFKFCIAYFAIFTLLFTSCTKDENEANKVDPSSEFVELTFGAVLNDLANRAMTKNHFDQVPTCSSETPATATVGFSVNGVEQDDVEVAILSDENGFFTAYHEDFKILVPSDGTVEITINSFIVKDGDGDTIWVAPIESVSGEFDGYVDQALPYSFDLEPGTKPYIDIEVLCFDRRLVNEYGYLFFDLVPERLYPLCFFANLCLSTNGRHYVGNYSVQLFYDDGEDRIELYSDSRPDTGVTNGNYYARPVCLVVPGSPYADADEDYLFYVITPLDWPASYGDIVNTPMTEVGLSWNDVNGLLNDDLETNEYVHVFIGCAPPSGDCPGVPTPGDRDGDCVPDDEDECPDVPGTPANFGCPLDDCDEDTDGDGVNDCDDLCPDVQGPISNNGCPEDDGGDTCETAFMFGDTPINTLGNSNRWGWAENFDTSIDGSSKTFNFWAGAGQNDTSKGELVGTITLTVDGDQVNFDIDLAAGVTLDDLHVHLSEENPGNIAKSPGQYNRNDDVSVDDLDFTLTRTSSDSSFWVIVHGVTCY